MAANAFHLLRQLTLTCSDLLLRLRGASQNAIAGVYTEYRRERAQGKPICPP
ncbi:MAG: hypothetical protein WB462_02790 [Solirubrobacterales bacterium]|jgi:hypothetical protein